MNSKRCQKENQKKKYSPLLLALSTKAKQAGINFTKEDTLLIIEQVKDELTEQERQMLPQILALIGK